MKYLPPALSPFGRAPIDAKELPLEMRYLLSDAPAVHLELRLARPPCSDPPRLPREMLPEPSQPWQGVGELRDLYLDSRLPRPRAPREDVENNLGSIDDAAFVQEAATEIEAIQAEAATLRTEVLEITHSKL